MKRLVLVALLLLTGLAVAAAEPSAAPPSLSDLDALIQEDAAPVPSFGMRDIFDLAALFAFLALAMISFFLKSKPLKYLTMVVAIGYMGFMKGNLVSLVHIFGALELAFPIFRYNISWYVLMLFTIASTVFWGRLYCGRICAFGALTQLMDKIIPARFRFELPRRFDRKAIYIKYIILISVISYFLLTGNNFVYKYVEPFWMFTLNGTVVTWTLLTLLFLTTIFIRNFYCRYLCSVGATLGLISNLTIFGIKRWKQCDTCKLCDKVCEWGAIQGPKISKAECVRCDDCEILYSNKDRCVHWLMIKKNSLKKALTQRA